MSSDGNKENNKVLSVAKFPHKLDIPRATRWRDWEIGRNYDETGVTDAISQYDEWVKAKTFNPKDIMAWVSGVEEAFDGWNNVVGQNPSYMSSVEIVRGILSNSQSSRSP